MSRLKRKTKVLPRPRLTVALILAWADTHHARTGRWPTVRSGLIHASPLGENWHKVESALLCVAA